MAVELRAIPIEQIDTIPRHHCGAHSRSYVSERIVASCRSELSAADGHYPDRLLAGQKQRMA